jgi:hypothetical protein
LAVLMSEMTAPEAGEPVRVDARLDVTPDDADAQPVV